MYPTDPLESPWKYDGTYQARHLALLDLIRIAAGGGGSGYDFDLLNQEATQLLIKGVLDDLKAKDFATEATLLAIDAVLDAIKVKTDNIDVALSTRATEATLLNVLAELGGASASSQTRTSVTVNNIATLLASSNADRKGLFLYNDSGANIYVGFSNTITASNFTVRLQNNAYWEMPNPFFTGNVYGIRNSGSGNMLVTEIQ